MEEDFKSDNLSAENITPEQTTSVPETQKSKSILKLPILIGFAILLLAFAGAASAYLLLVQKGVLFSSKQNESPIVSSPNPTVSDIVPSSASINTSAEKYSVQELSSVITNTIDGAQAVGPYLSDEAKSKCLAEVSQYVYTFPGYKYGVLQGVAREGHDRNANANALIAIYAKKLNNAEVASGIGETQGDSYTFEFSNNNGFCKLLTANIYRTIVPKDVYGKALTLAGGSPKVSEFLKTGKNVVNRSVGWIDDNTKQFTNYFEITKYINGYTPTKGIIIMEFSDDNLRSQEVYVDLFISKVYANDPIHIVPR